MTSTIQPLETEIDSRAAWLEARRKGIGGSDAAVACGLSPYKTQYQLYLEKRGEAPDDEPENPERLEWGVRLEDAIAEAYAQRTGRRVHRVNRILRSAEHPFMLANLDRRIVGERRGLECKNVDALAFKFGEWGEGIDEIPSTYHLQIEHYLAVTGYETFDLAALIGGNTLRIYTIPRDEELIATLVDLEAAFWRCVELGVAPDVASVADARARFPKSVATAIEATPEILEDLDRLVVLSQNTKTAEGELDATKGRICAYMGECEELTFDGKRLATWKTSERKGYVVKPSTVRTFRTVRGD